MHFRIYDSSSLTIKEVKKATTTILEAKNILDKLLLIRIARRPGQMMIMTCCYWKGKNLLNSPDCSFQGEKNVRLIFVWRDRKAREPQSHSPKSCELSMIQPNCEL